MRCGFPILTCRCAMSVAFFERSYSASIEQRNKGCARSLGVSGRLRCCIVSERRGIRLVPLSGTQLGHVHEAIRYHKVVSNPVGGRPSADWQRESQAGCPRPDVHTLTLSADGVNAPFAYGYRKTRES